METNFPRYWMWSEAFEMLARAERMHQQFFRPSGSASRIAWEPPVDVLETERAVLVLVALPGVDPGEVKALIDGGRARHLRDSRAIRPRCRPRSSTASSCRRAASSGAFPCRRALRRHPSIRRQRLPADHAAESRSRAMAEAETATVRKRPPARSADAAAAAGRAHHRAGARHRAVSRHGAADHARPPELDPGRAAGGARAEARSAFSCSATPRSADPHSRRHAPHGHGRQYRPLHHRARRLASSRLPGRAAVPGRRLPERLAVPRRARARIPEPDRVVDRDRGALRPSARARRSRRCNSCRRRRTNCSRRSRPSKRPARSPTWSRPTWTRRRTRSRKSSRRSTSARAWTRVSRLLAHRIEVLRLSQEIGRETKASLDARKREVLLREQMAAIQRQLGEGDEGKAAEIAELEKAIAKAHMPKEVEDQARKELRRLQRMPEAAGEYGMVRTYLDWLIELPWALPEEKPIDIAEARRILDEDHFGLEKIKRRIIEYLAVRKLAPNGKAPILCFVGPPGVGKTSLGQSIARAMDRKFVRVSLGGVHDEAEIRGHRRTYIGALPGNIIQAIRKAGARNCVMMLDEIDKLGAGIQGDPGAALARGARSRAEQHVPRQLSRGAVRSEPSGVHRHRQHARHHPGAAARPHGDHQPPRLHGRARSSQIARRYLVRAPVGGERPQAGSGRDRRRGAARHHPELHARGGRAQSRAPDRPGAAPRRGAHRRGRERADPRSRATISPPSSGAPTFENEVAMRTSVPGVATGLAWTPVGGDILFIEATAHSGRRQADPHRPARRRDEGKRAGGALSIVKNRAAALGIDPGRFEKSDIHIHVPAGATPEGRPERGRRDVHGARLAADRPHHPQRHRDDRRDQPARARAAGRRHQGEGGRRAPRPGSSA